eukprot:scaffold21620_cov65-Phaeocystis_antarctica.AAC.6
MVGFGRGVWVQAVGGRVGAEVRVGAGVRLSVGFVRAGTKVPWRAAIDTTMCTHAKSFASCLQSVEVQRCRGAEVRAVWGAGVSGYRWVCAEVRFVGRRGAPQAVATAVGDEPWLTMACAIGRVGRVTVCDHLCHCATRVVMGTSP